MEFFFLYALMKLGYFFLLRIHIYWNSHPLLQWKHRKENGEITVNMTVFAPNDKVGNNVIIIWKRHSLVCVYVLKGEWNSTSTYVPAQLTKDKLLLHHIENLTKIDLKIDKCELPTCYWLPKLHQHPYTSRLISNSSHGTSLLQFFKSILHPH